MIEAFNLTKLFGDFMAVNNVSLRVPEGEVLALLGPNGAGKTTTVRILGSILKPTSGHARIAGYDTITQAKEVRRLIGLLTEFPGLYMRMNGLEYLRFFGELQGMRVADITRRSEELLTRFKLWDAAHKQVGNYSKGMKQKLTLVRAMLHDPLVLFLDEPTSAMGPAKRQAGARRHCRPAPRKTHHRYLHTQPGRSRATGRPHRHCQPGPNYRPGHAHRTYPAAVGRPADGNSRGRFAQRAGR